MFRQAAVAIVLAPAFEHRGVRMSRPGYHLGDDVVWGMTERILTPLLRLLGARIPVVPTGD